MMGAIYAQPAPAPRFEVAAIKPTPSDQWDGPSGGDEGKGRYTMYNRTLKRYIMAAYSLGPNQIVGGPPWLDADRFDISAKAEQPVDADEVLMEMVRTLLAERCKLAVHRESRPIAVYVLEVAKNGPKLEKVTDSATSATTNSSRGSIDAQAITMTRFAEVLSRQMDLPVVDKTGLDGSFNLKLKWSTQTERPTPPGHLPSIDTGSSIFAAIQNLGLRMQARKASVEMLVIDHVERPSQN
jgi:uncharacterized protein (TIGR03435 family)